MTQLDQNYASGNQFTVGTVRAASVGPSGINDIVGRVNFGGFEFPQIGSVEFTYTNSRISKVTVSGSDQRYDVDIVYNGNLVGSVVTSGTSIGSQITTTFYGTGVTYVSGITKFE